MVALQSLPPRPLLLLLRGYCYAAATAMLPSNNVSSQSRKRWRMIKMTTAHGPTKNSTWLPSVAPGAVRECAYLSIAIRAVAFGNSPKSVRGQRHQ